MSTATIDTSSSTRYKWIKLTKHCNETGDTPNAVHARRHKRQWTEGVQCKVGPDGNLYINPEEYNKWVESPSQKSFARAA
jgi:hypothetical protein